MNTGRTTTRHSLFLLRVFLVGLEELQLDVLLEGRLVDHDGNVRVLRCTPGARFDLALFRGWQGRLDRGLEGDVLEDHVGLRRL